MSHIILFWYSLTILHSKFKNSLALKLRWGWTIRNESRSTIGTVLWKLSTSPVYVFLQWNYVWRHAGVWWGAPISAASTLFPQQRPQLMKILKTPSLFCLQCGPCSSPHRISNPNPEKFAGSEGIEGQKPCILFRKKVRPHAEIEDTFYDGPPLKSGWFGGSRIFTWIEI